MSNSTKLKAGYDETSPLTGNYAVLVEQVEFDDVPEGMPSKDLYKICMETGYQTYWNSWRTDNPEMLSNLEKQMPTDIANFRYVDDFGHVWYPMMTFTYVAALYPWINSNSQLEWAVSEVRPIESEADIATNKIIKLPVETDKGVTLGIFKIMTPPDRCWPLHEFESALNEYEARVTEWNQSQTQNIRDEEE